MMNMDILEELEPSSELDLEPQFRERSNTWPLRPNRVELESPQLHQNGGSPTGSEERANGIGMVVGSDGHATSITVKQEKGGGGGVAAGDPLGLTGGVKKSGARRNAWGPSSYADLITNAIQSSPEKRLTLSQIYDWMVQNVPYFKDKGDSTSAAGWKNSIRHNLSLHSRFMRIQNEGTGKSSWWVINPDAKPGKPPRRRAGSMDTKSGEKKRGRINKKKQEAIRSALENRGSPLNGSIDFLDTLSMGDFRSRASSNASSCSRLSPIPPDLHDNQVPPMSPIPWDGEVDASAGFQGPEHFPELASSLADSMNLSSQDSMDMSLSCNLNSDSYLSSGGTQEFANMPEKFKGLSDLLKERSQLSPLGAPPPYPERTLPYPDSIPPAQAPQPQSSSVVKQEQPAVAGYNYNMSKLRLTLMNKLKAARIYNMDPVNMMNQVNSSQGQLSINTQQQTTTIGTPEGSQHSSPSNNPPQSQSLAPHLSPTSQGQTSPQGKVSPLGCQLSPQQQQALLGSPDQQMNLSPKIQQQNSLQQQQQQQQEQQQQQSKSILRSALTHGAVIFNQPSSNNSVQFILGMTQSSPTTATNTGNLNTNIANLGLSTEQQQLQQLQQQLQQQQQQQQQPPPPQPQQQQQPQQMPLSSSTSSFLSQLTDSGNLTAGPVVNNAIVNGIATLSNGNNNLPADIQVDTGNFMNLTDYELEEVIKQELTLEGNLDATFDNIMPV